MIQCTFHLNGGQLSTLSCPGIGFFLLTQVIKDGTETIPILLRNPREARFLQVNTTS